MPFASGLGQAALAGDTCVHDVMQQEGKEGQVEEGFLVPVCPVTPARQSQLCQAKSVAQDWTHEPGD